MKQIEFIPLAAKKIAQRGLTAEQVSDAIQNSEQRVSGYGGRTVYQRRLRLPGKKEQLMRVICEEGEKLIVITAYLTSDIGRYWRS